MSTEMEQAVWAEWQKSTRTPGKSYKLLVTNGWVHRFIASIVGRTVTAVHISPYNLSKYAIYSKRETTALTVVISSGVARSKIAPASAAQIEAFLKCWPDHKGLL